MRNNLLRRQIQENNPSKVILEFCTQCIRFKMLEHNICQACIAFLDEIDINSIQTKNANNYWFSRAG